MSHDLTDRLASIERKLDAIIKERELDASPYLRGDQAAANYAGYRSRGAFLRWAGEQGIRPRKDEQINFWAKHEIKKARDKQKY